MIALRERCWVVTNSEMLINYLLEDRGDLRDGLLLEFWGELPPDACWVDWHKTSH
jgi:hypothetical protein